jgi:hypothetical protein
MTTEGMRARIFNSCSMPQYQKQDLRSNTIDGGDGALLGANTTYI